MKHTVESMSRSIVPFRPEAGVGHDDTGVDYSRVIHAIDFDGNPFAVVQPERDKSRTSDLTVRKKDKEKGLCTRCGFVVVVDGHESRCRVPVDYGEIKNLAWIGDSAWELFVRSAIVRYRTGEKDTQKYTKNDVLAARLSQITQFVTFSVPLPDNASSHTKASFVEAALAISSFCRVTMALHFGLAGVGPENLSLWEPRVDIGDFINTVFKPQPYVDGYCYLHLFPSHLYEVVAIDLRVNPPWGKVKKAIQDRSLDKYVHLSVMVSNSCCHISKVHFPDMVHYSGLITDLPIDPMIQVGGMKKVNLSCKCKDLAPKSTWSSDLVHAYEELRLLCLRIMGEGKVVLLPQGTFKKIEPLWCDDQQSDQVLKPLRSLHNKLLVGTALLSTRTTYIAVSGSISFVAIPEASALGYMTSTEIDSGSVSDSALDWSSTESDTD